MAKIKANEREFQGQVIAWITKQIEQGGLSFQRATNDSSLYGLPRVKYPDIALFLDFECEQPFCGWELKTPRTDVRDKKLLKDSVKKAQTLNAKYFVTWNMQTAIIWKTPPKTRITAKEEDKVREFEADYRISSVGDIRDAEKALLLEDRCAQLLRDLERLYQDEKVNLPVTDTTFFVNLVSSVTKQMAGFLVKDVNRARAKKSFERKLKQWGTKQGISKYDSEYWDTLARQISYKIVGKVLFYITMRRHKLDLPRMVLPTDNYKQAMRKMRWLFQQALEVDYQAIFEPDTTDEIALSENTVNEIIKLTESLSHWSFELMPLDVVGNVFEKLIPEEARHSLGQYFTPDNLVDLIVSFCVRGGDDYVMDPTCGTGTFLIRSYNKLKNLKRKKHHKLLEQIWGFDIAGFPAELATINLCRQDFSDYLNFPRVLSRDFFDVMSGMSFGFPPPKKTAYSGEHIKVKMPRFDALVGNFPFIRQELIEKQEKGYKKKLEEVLFESWGKSYPALFNRRTAGKNQKTVHNLQLSGQADIYAYMFFHTAAHLKVGGRMGFITSNSWLDVAYGYELQKFFLSKFKIVAICESRCEPWFEQSAVNTVFTILERSDDVKANRDNQVRFVKLKKQLGQLFQEDALTDAQNRWNRLDWFVEKIEGIAATGKLGRDTNCKKFDAVKGEYINQPGIISYEDDEIRMRIIGQGDLADEAERAGQTVKWGQYLRAPDIYFEILRKCIDKFVPLVDVVDIRRGITTGINEFFYLTDDKIKHWGIEEEFLRLVIKSPKECADIKLKKKDLKFHAFLCHKDKSELKGTKALKYIKWGERQKTKSGQSWTDVPSVSGRGDWYDLPKREPGLLLLPMVSGNSLRCIINSDKAQVDHNLFEVISDDEKLLAGLGIYLNSAASFIQRELIGRANLGDGALKIEGIDWKRILVPDKETILKIQKEAGKVFGRICKRNIKDIKTESKKKDRLEFEKAVFGCLGLGEKEVKAVFDTVVELVEERHLLPKLRSRRKKVRAARDYGKLKEEISGDVLREGVRWFPDSFVRGWPRVECEEVSVAAEKLKLGENFFGKQQICDEQGEHLFDVESVEKGKFIVYAKRAGEYVVKVPRSNIAIGKAVQEYEIYLKELSEHLFGAFMEQSGDYNVSEALTKQVLEEYGLPDIR